MFCVISTLPSWRKSEYFTTISLKLHGPSFAGREEHHVSSKRPPPLLLNDPSISNFFQFKGLSESTVSHKDTCFQVLFCLFVFFFLFICSFIFYCKSDRELTSVFILHSSINTKLAVSFACYNVSSHVRVCSLTLVRGPDSKRGP